ncbi:hypothetical protein GALL_62480 [mine drainage metagenome]|uniref:Uncharacterized protein n=1 Tax=mine drainage metagenome TaxID=410659 RepID=A0A1J5TFQ7_9ZZZZ
MPVFVITFFGLFNSDKSFAATPVLSAINTSSVALKAKYKELNYQLLNNQFKRALYLNSEESTHYLKGEIYAVVNYPFATFNSALNNPAHWCDALILNINIKYCHAANNQDGNALVLNIGKKSPQLLSQTYRLEFKYSKMISATDYFATELDSRTGPLGTYDYHISIEATPLKYGQTFFHFTYAYSFGIAGSLAMQTYLATIGRNKVGFTVTGKQDDGQPAYIKGIRGLVERNTMRYYLAIDSYLASLTQPNDDQLEKSLQYWYRSSEQYARQLHEIEQDEYLNMKRKEYQRQQVVQ